MLWKPQATCVGLVKLDLSPKLKMISNTLSLGGGGCDCAASSPGENRGFKEVGV